VTLVTTLEAAADRGVEPRVIRKWVERGKLKPVGMKQTGRPTAPTMLFDLVEVRAASLPREPRRGKEATRKPVERLAAVPAPPERLPAGLLQLEALGRFERAEPSDPLGGGVHLGWLLLGPHRLRVSRAVNGVVYHETTAWMDDDPDWMDNPDYAYTLEVLHAA
jgi:hypothetical protein